MVELQIPGFGEFELLHAVIDFNGTLAFEGQLIEGIKERLKRLSENLQLHIITGDSYGNAKCALDGVNCQLTILPTTEQAVHKKQYVLTLGPKSVVAIGNGRNDQYMLKEAALGIAVLGTEGVATEAMLAADIFMPEISSALDALLSKKRLIATLRS